ncbi:cytosine-specific methyltransferase [Nocardia neocaledoniensis NBRC 108232]|uniref:DNA (cytosine-5-)-methyltransferase n=1 Tax=Nocardia neocaledoniensis TaxID=236511 RepID=A0A317P4Y2_9NOCA|nr:DNA cytosine methyltransferase [Nocardia neocaledoniensis]PWV81444.1 DNA (cytosine-5)-methyltransferase 1 [Nocardia neocaledoniensis]GEM31366.1 cytosine-specific methyltransferase [Nocardia neocaledoniensis NBRC 108232]
MDPKNVSVIDFFSGCGGTSQGFKDAGMNITAGIDFDPDSAATFRHNFEGSTFIESDIRKVEIDQIRDLMPEGPTLFAGCAPCQPFSRQNRTTTDQDPRRNLLYEFSRFVTTLRPEFVVVENVPGLQNPKKSGPLEDFMTALTEAGYIAEYSILRALEFGVPQERKRLVIVASRIGSSALPKPTHVIAGGKPMATVRQAIETLPPILDGDVHPDDPDHATMRLSEINKLRIRSTPEGGDRRNWTKELVLPCHTGHGGHTDTYGRMWWDRAASGLTTRCISYSNGRFGHPEQHRAISVREAACLQTFPRDFRFAGTLTSKARQVGNAVPPLMAKRIGQALTAAT